MRIICLFNLKAGASREAYEAWARSSDIPAVNGLGSVNSFTVHRATGLFGSDAAPPYDYIEIIDIKDMDDFVADVSSPTIQEIGAAFGQFTDNPTFILTDDL